MVDKITNSLINLENKASKNSTNVKNSISKVNNYENENSTNHHTVGNRTPGNRFSLRKTAKSPRRTPVKSKHPMGKTRGQKQ